MKQGIDISHWNRIINFDRIAKQIDFCIIKAGGSDKGFYRDSTFLRNYQALHDERGIPCGAYYYVGRNCITPEAGCADAHRFIEILAGMPFEYPVYIDLESTSPKHREGATQAVIAFCETMEKNGYYTGVYASDVSGFIDRLDLSKLDRYDKWVARYGSEPKKVKEYGMWQKTSSGMIEGIADRVDLDEAYMDYPAIMKRTGLNNVR